MGAPIQKTLTLMLGGTSLTAGRLCTPPLPWTRYLMEDMTAAPECQGPVRIINTGAGSQTSNFGASQAALLAPMRPTHVLMEDFAINDCAIGPVTIPQATINFNSMVASYRAANPSVIIAHQTMSPASAADVARANLAAYYDNGLANAALNDLESLDNYYGTVLVPGGWPKPLPISLTVGYQPPSGMVPAGFTEILGTWDPLAKHPSVSLSNADLTANFSENGRGVRGTNGTSTQKSYFTVSPSNLGYIGIATTGYTLDANLGEIAFGYGYNGTTGQVVYSSTIVANYATFGPGDTIGVAFDPVALKLWFAKNGVWQSGDPTTGTGGLSILAGTYYAACSANIGWQMTLNPGATGDGLHPVWPLAFELYSYPNIIAWARRMMAAFW